MSQTISLDLDELFEPDSYDRASHAVHDVLENAREPGWAKLTIAMIRSRLGSAFDDALDDIDLFGLFAQGWAKAHELMEFGDPAKHKPNVTAYMRIGTIKQEQDVDLETRLFLGPLTSRPVIVTIVFSGEFEAVELAIRNGHIKRASGGACTLSAKFEVAGSEVFPGRKLKEFRLPGQHTFGRPGIALPGADRFAHAR